MVIPKDSVLLLRKVAEYLQDEGVGTIGSDLFINAMPEKPVVGTVVAHVGGISLADDPTRRPALTVQHRNTHVSSALPKAVEIHNLFDNKVNVMKGLPGRFVVSSEAGVYFRDDSGHVVSPVSFVFVTTSQA